MSYVDLWPHKAEGGIMTKVKGFSRVSTQLGSARPSLSNPLPPTPGPTLSEHLGVRSQGHVTSADYRAQLTEQVSDASW